MERVDCSLKMQRPIKFDEKGFELSKGIVIAWYNHKHKDESLRLAQRGEGKVINN